jgi:hypothetical protein
VCEAAIYVTASGTNAPQLISFLHSYRGHPGEHYRQIFQEILHNNALDGSEDEILWEDDVEDKDDSDWVTDNDCYE